MAVAHVILRGLSTGWNEHLLPTMGYGGARSGSSWKLLPSTDPIIVRRQIQRLTKILGEIDARLTDGGL
jgi:hypothetical protein